MESKGTSRTWSWTTALALLVLALPTLAQQEAYKLTASDAAAGDLFGFYVSISGDRAIVGAVSDDDGGPMSGSAYIYSMTTGQEMLKLTASDATSGVSFGRAVAISGDRAIVGCPYNKNGTTYSQGAAYVFDVNTGAELFKLTASDADFHDNLGWSVAISGNLAIVGAVGENDHGWHTGAAYVFDVTTGEELFKLTASDAHTFDDFGQSVAIRGNRAFVGAPGNDVTGSAYVFDTMTGEELYKLKASDAWAGDSFGYSVSISGNRALVGAHDNDDNDTDSGSAYVFDMTTGQELYKLTASDGAYMDYFGYSVSLSGDLAVIGAYSNDEDALFSGSAYVFDVTTGEELYKVRASDAQFGDEFGRCVGISGNRLIAGAARESDNGNLAGAVYVFSDLEVLYRQELLKMTASDGAAGDGFGCSVSISGDRAIVGALNDDDDGNYSGSAYIFNMTTGQQLYKLTASDAGPFDFFGKSVSISGNRAVVGAYNNGDGAVYVFNVATGQELYKLNLSDELGDGDDFGYSVSIDGNRMIVGAPRLNGYDYYTGGAYIFDVTTGQRLRTLLAPDGDTGDKFGRSVAISGDRVVVGAYGDDDAYQDSGSAYLYDTSSGMLITKVDLTDPGNNDEFGRSVAISGDRTLIGSYAHRDNGYFAGSAWIFNSNTGHEDLQLLPLDAPFEHDYFGWSVAIDGDRALVGASADSDPHLYSGSAYVFDASDGRILLKLIASDGAAADNFGHSVAINGNRAIIGAIQDDGSGSVYVFDTEFTDCNGNGNPDSWDISTETSQDCNGDGIPDECETGNDCNSNGIHDACETYNDCDSNGTPDDCDLIADPTLDQNGNGVFDACECGAQNYCNAAPNSTGVPGRISWTGSLFIEDDFFALTATNLPPLQAGIFFYGPGKQSIPYGDGVLCIGGGFYRLNPAVLANAQGECSRIIHFGDAPTGSGPGKIESGSTWNFQLWHRDPSGGPVGFTYSDGLEVTFCP